MHNHFFVIKCGGSTLSALPEQFYKEMTQLQRQGSVPVIVHGGGPAISELLSALNIETEFVDGLRKTTNEVLDVVEMVLSGKINKQIVRMMQQFGAQAIGLSGVDGQLIEAEPVENTAQIGYVGKVKQVNAALIKSVIAAGYIPVIAPIGIGPQGQRYNINADTAAGAVASHLGVKQMIVVTDVPGIMQEVGGVKQVMPQLTVTEIDALIAQGQIYGGMIPKVKAALDCLQGEVEEVVIADGSEHSILSKIISGEKVGTRIIRER